eukprot:gnl/TRDRNA2_/TRDRNA2_185477_c0_seq1.p1 gnl/TRDRNA2_/TRDRNA2_185477_c0~~gnl/TRDRNA2_/TRDRNA2_185477_c0_seq1.p1  ORF type:complete len:458 (-),score=92.97 gnl/TRDRNA2_/TRDRNA2_185477_c0_seq1:82-1455(-)
MLHYFCLCLTFLCLCCHLAGAGPGICPADLPREACNIPDEAALVQKGIQLHTSVVNGHATEAARMEEEVRRATAAATTAAQSTPGLELFEALRGRLQGITMSGNSSIRTEDWADLSNLANTTLARFTQGIYYINILFNDIQYVVGKYQRQERIDLVPTVNASYEILEDRARLFHDQVVVTLKELKSLDKTPEPLMNLTRNVMNNMNGWGASYIEWSFQTGHEGLVEKLVDVLGPIGTPDLAGEPLMVPRLLITSLEATIKNSVEMLVHDPTDLLEGNMFSNILNASVTLDSVPSTTQALTEAIITTGVKLKLATWERAKQLIMAVDEEMGKGEQACKEIQQAFHKLRLMSEQLNYLPRHGVPEFDDLAQQAADLLAGVKAAKDNLKSSITTNMNTLNEANDKLLYEAVKVTSSLGVKPGGSDMRDTHRKQREHSAGIRSGIGAAVVAAVLSVSASRF